MSAIDRKALAAATAAVTAEIARYWNDDTVEPGHGPVAEAAVRAYLAALAPQQAAPMPVTIIHGSPIARFVQSYQFDASDEGIVHTPTHDEQCMIEDAICSFISDERLLHEALGITPEAGTSEREPETWEGAFERLTGVNAHPAPAQAPVDGEAVRAIPKVLEKAFVDILSDMKKFNRRGGLGMDVHESLDEWIELLQTRVALTAPSARKEP